MSIGITDFSSSAGWLVRLRWHVEAPAGRAVAGSIIVSPVANSIHCTESTLYATRAQEQHACPEEPEMVMVHIRQSTNSQGTTS
jgi:hypothetical protein